MDTCCSDNVASTQWLENYILRLGDGDKTEIKGPLESERTFTFGTNEVGGEVYHPDKHQWTKDSHRARRGQIRYSATPFQDGDEEPKCGIRSGKGIDHDPRKDEKATNHKERTTSSQTTTSIKETRRRRTH